MRWRRGAGDRPASTSRRGRRAARRCCRSAGARPAWELAGDASPPAHDPPRGCAGSPGRVGAGTGRAAPARAAPAASRRAASGASCAGAARRPPRPRGRPRAALAAVRLPRLLPAVHPGRRGRRAVPRGARALPPRPGAPAHRRRLGRARQIPVDDRVLLRQLRPWTGWSPATRARPAPPSACSTWPPGTGSPRRTRCCGASTPDVEALFVTRSRRRAGGVPGPDRRLLRARRPGPAALARASTAARRCAQALAAFVDDLRGAQPPAAQRPTGTA